MTTAAVPGEAVRPDEREDPVPARRWDGLLTPHRKNVLMVAAGLAAVPVATAHAMPIWFPPSLITSLTIGTALAMAALSVNLLLGYAGQLSIGHAALLGAGAFAASLVVDRWQGPMLLGLVVAAVVSGVIALAIGLPALRLRGLYLAVVTIVFGITMQYSVLRWEFFTRGSAGALLPRRLWGMSMLEDGSVFLSVALLVLLGAWLVDRNVLRTRLGRAFRMIREDEVAAQAFGIDVTRYKLSAFVLSGAMAGLAGALYGHAIGLVNSDVFPLELSIRLVIIVIIGGIGHRWGVAAVAIMLAMSGKLPDVFRSYDLVAAALITLYNVVRLPGGLVSVVSHLRARGTHGGSVHEDGDPIVPDLVAVEAARRAAPAAGAGSGSDPEGAGGGLALEVRNMTVRFGGLLAVDDVSVQVARGSVVGIIGPNGAGKSTLFNAISGLVPGAAGEVLLEGRPLTGLPPHQRATRGLGRTFQQVGLAKEMTVRENVLLAQHLSAGYHEAAALLYTRGVDTVERDLIQRANATVEALGFARYADTPLGLLSGGQQRLVELAAVLSTSPRLLMLDEPTAGLSPAAAENLADRLHALRAERGQTILLIEHNVPLVLDLCDEIYVLNAGALLASGPPHELASQPRVLGAYLGETL